MKYVPVKKKSSEMFSGVNVYPVPLSFYRFSVIVLQLPKICFLVS